MDRKKIEYGLKRATELYNSMPYLYHKEHKGREIYEWGADLIQLVYPAYAAVHRYTTEDRVETTLRDINKNVILDLSGYPDSDIVDVIMGMCEAAEKEGFEVVMTKLEEEYLHK